MTCGRQLRVTRQVDPAIGGVNTAITRSLQPRAHADRAQTAPNAQPGPVSITR